MTETKSFDMHDDVIIIVTNDRLIKSEFILADIK